MMLNGKQLIELGYPEGKVIGTILTLQNRLVSEMDKDTFISQLKEILEQPQAYVDLEPWKDIASTLLAPKKGPKELREESQDIQIYGKELIEQGALHQMNIAMKLPIAIAGALMPDAHQGYGLPIGGVLATENQVIPYGVGVDIGCRMCMTIYDVPTGILQDQKANLKKILLDSTRFGKATFKKPMDHEILDNSLFNDIQLIKSLKDRAWKQLGSSGGGNHFVEFGEVEILDPQNEFGLAVGTYLAVLSHSGSRGLGAKIAGHYTKVAMATCKLPKEARHLAWLDLDSSEGQEYWAAMNLAGDYASACHHQIHERMAISLGAEPLSMIENHHNFAWKEQDEAGNEMIVHRKGATPAGKGVLGIIPGSMTAPGFIVRGKGNVASINSASHGAGRVMSRTQAKKSLKQEKVADYLRQAQVEVLGSGLDEAPMAYKDISEVMACQEELVEIVGKFQPRIVRMCGDKAYGEKD